MRVLLAIAAALLVSLLYAGRLSSPFVFDDRTSILDNASIRSLSLPTSLIDPRPGSPTAGRPLVNFSFALNHALFGLEPLGYHATNLALHLGCSALVFLCLAQLLNAPRSPAPLRRHAPAIAGMTALLFAVHPIGVEIVLYTSQRSESLAALFFLLAWYAFLRHAAGHGGRGTLLLASAASICGALCKESVAPLSPLALLCDRAFYAGSLGAALRQRGRLHAALLAGYVPLLALVATSPRGASASLWHPDYLLAQGRYVSGYLSSVFVPELAFDYGAYRPELAHGAWPFAIAIAALVLASALSCITHPRLGFPLAWVFGLLAPTSSVIAIHSEVAADRRMYLPMIALLAAAVCGLVVLLSRLGERRGWPERARALLGWAYVLLACSAFALQTRVRTDAFTSETAFWQQALAEQPGNPRAAYNYGEALQRAGELDAAERAYEVAIYLDRRYAEAHSNLGSLLMRRGRVEDGVTHLRRAVELSGSASAHYNYGLAMNQLGRFALARAEFERALALDPDYAEAHVNLGIQLLTAGEAGRGLAHLERGVALRPDPQALLNYALALIKLGRPAEARSQLERALALDPNHEAARAQLARLAR